VCTALAEPIEDRRDLAIDAGALVPDVRDQHRDQLGERARTVDTDALRVRAEVTPPRQAVATAPADDVPFGADDVARHDLGDSLGNVLDGADAHAGGLGDDVGFGAGFPHRLRQRIGTSARVVAQPERDAASGVRTRFDSGVEHAADEADVVDGRRDDVHRLISRDLRRRVAAAAGPINGRDVHAGGAQLLRP